MSQTPEEESRAFRLERARRFRLVLTAAPAGFAGLVVIARFLIPGKFIFGLFGRESQLYAVVSELELLLLGSKMEE